MAWFRRSRPEPISDEELGGLIERNVALARRFDTETRLRHRDLTRQLVDHVMWETVAGLELTNTMKVTIAANATIPILALDLGIYRQVRAVIIHPSLATSSDLRDSAAHGTFSDDPITVSGLALPESGPLVFAWDVVHYDSRHPLRGVNVVIHEFAHKIDMSDGYTDGIPPLRGEALEDWSKLLAREFRNPRGAADDPVLDDYAWTSPPEFFAVATEAFFCMPDRLAEGRPELYAALSDLYQQDPASGFRGCTR